MGPLPHGHGSRTLVWRKRRGVGGLREVMEVIMPPHQAGWLVRVTLFVAWLYSLLVVPAACSWSMNNILLGRPKHDNYSLIRSTHATLPGYLLLADSISKGMELGLSECQYQFRWERWDCSDRSLLQVVHTAETPANQETAVVQALVTSGVMYVVARNCSTGALLSCTCDPHLHSNHTERNWKWKGCKNAGAKQGDTMSRALFDGVIEGADARAAVNRHNNQVGRAAVWRNLELRCKCHGVSGSCSLRTCWQRLPDFRRVGTFLKRRYTRAVHVNVQDGQLRHGNRARRRGLSMISSKDLVYLVPSPDYCRAQALGGAASSTEGRECSRPPKGLKASRAERRSCRTLCLECGLRVRKYMVEVVTRCNCKFYWCCTVRCKECRQVVQKYYCQR